MSKSHIRSILPVTSLSSTIDESTTFLAHYDEDTNDVSGIVPADRLYDDSLLCSLQMGNLNSAGTYVIDESKYGKHGMISGATQTDGIRGKALAFDGTDDYVRLSKYLTLGNIAWSVFAWVKTSSTGRNPVLSHWSSGPVYNALSIYNSKISYWHYNNAWLYEYGTSIIADGNWHFLGWVNYANKTMDLYVDGVKEATVDSTLSGANLGLVNNVGRDWANTLNGSIASLAVYDRSLTESEVKNLFNKSIYSIVPSGKYGNAIAVEEATTNLWNGGFTIYNNYNVPASLTPLDEYYLGQRVYRLAMTVDDAHSTSLSNFQGSLSSHGVRGSSVTYKANTKYASSIYWRMVNKKDILVGGTASNIGGWADSGTFDVGDGWKRSVTYRDGTVTSDKNGEFFWSFRCPSLALNETVYIDWCCNQIEESRDFATSYIYGARATGKLTYSPNIIDLSEGTISCWFRPGVGFFSGSWNRIIGHCTALNVNEIELMRNNTVSTLAFAISDNAGSPAGGSWNGVRSTTILDQSVWYHLAVTWSKSAGKTELYVNGNLEGSLTGIAATAFPSVYGTLQVGYHPNAANRMANGQIDELRIDRVARSADEILSWYLSGGAFLHHDRG